MMRQGLQSRPATVERQATMAVGILQVAAHEAHPKDRKNGDEKITAWRTGDLHRAVGVRPDIRSSRDDFPALGLDGIARAGELQARVRDDVDVRRPAD